MKSALPSDLARTIIHYLPIEIQLFIFLQHTSITLTLFPSETCRNSHSQYCPKVRIWADFQALYWQSGDKGWTDSSKVEEHIIHEIMEEIPFSTCECRSDSIEKQVVEFLDRQISTIPISFHEWLENS
jgi:hypothetical protein